MSNIFKLSANRQSIEKLSVIISYKNAFQESLIITYRDLFIFHTWIKLSYVLTYIRVSERDAHLRIEEAPGYNILKLNNSYNTKA